MTATASPAPAGELIHLGGHAFAHPDLAALLTDVGELVPFEDNPRRGDSGAIAESIRANGLYRPVYAQRSTRAVLAGNHTFAAAVNLGATRLPVVWLDVSDEQARRIVLADNRTADLGHYDDRVLLDLLNTLAHDEDGLIGTGYDVQDLDDLTLLLSRQEPPDLDELADELGEPAEDDGWVAITFRVPPESAELWAELVKGHGGDEVATFAALVGAA